MATDVLVDTRLTEQHAAARKADNQLVVSTGQYSSSGRKAINQDFYGVCIPEGKKLQHKGIAIALADGISSSQVSQIASETATHSFLDDYYATPDTWSVRKSASQVLKATNAWLHAQTRQSDFRFDMDKGYVCTFSALVLKSNTAHLFHTGDSRIYHYDGNTLEQLTHDHRLVVSADVSYLSRALGFDQQLDLDIQQLTIQQGDWFVLVTDGVYEYLSIDVLELYLAQYPDNPDKAAQAIAMHALTQGSQDNLTIQLVHIDQLPAASPSEFKAQTEQLPSAPLLNPPCDFEGLSVIRELHSNARSHVYLAEDPDTTVKLALKIPSTDQHEQPDYLESFMLEEWIARRINSPHVLKSYTREHSRQSIYTLTQYINGQNLAQWQRDNPAPSLEQVRKIVTQVARGLQSFHRQEMLHQDIRPENILIDHQGTVTIIDFGSVAVAGILEAGPEPDSYLKGTALYAAPEYFLGEAGTVRSEQFSLAVLTYFLLSGRYPYGTDVARARTRMAQYRLTYQSVLDAEREIPAWVDDTLKIALHTDPYKRFEELSEFIYRLSHPTPQSLNRQRPPLLERNPVAFWQMISACLCIIIILLITLPE